MAFGDLKKDAGITKLNEFLTTKSYLEGYVPSQSDVAAFTEVGKCPSSNLVNAARWYRQIASYSTSERSAFPGAKGNVAAAAQDDDEDDDDDDIDLFGEDEEADAEAEKIKADRIAAYQAKKSTKTAIIAKSNIILDVKPWDDETDMKMVEESVRTIATEGLLWGASKLVPLAYGIKKLQICCVVVDDLVGTDFLEEEITKFDELVQSVDIAAFNKI